MSLDRHGIERQGDCIFAKPCQGLKNCSPPVTFGPAVEAIVDRCIRPIFVWAIAPSGPRLQHVNDAADDAPAIVAAIVALGATGGVVYLPAGTYAIPNNTISLTSNVVLRGERSSNTTLFVGGLDTSVTEPVPFLTSYI